MADGQEAADRAAESFQGLLLRYRGRSGLTQRELAARVGVSMRTVENWEAGVNYPSAQPLQALITALLAAGGLNVGRELDEVRQLWAAVLRDAPRMRTPFDEVWLAEFLAERTAPDAAQLARELMPGAQVVSAAEDGAVDRRQDWGESPDVIGFVGRAEELATLRAWVLEEHCRLAAVLGMGGIGKTVFASQLAQDAAPSFHRVYWRSLRDALPVGEWMAGAIGFLSAHHLVPPEGEAARLAVLLELLRDRPSLLVLDNFETVLEPGQREGRYRDGFAGYGAVLQGIGETRHQSCLVVTSREAPPELAVLSGGAVRRFQLAGLGVPEGQVLLADKQLSGTDDDWANLIARFGGNGLALKVVGESISQVFGGDIGMFLEQSGSGTVFGGIRRLLAEQIERSSALEQEVLRVLAVEREPVTVAELIATLGPRLGRATVLEAVEALRRRSLVERAETAGRAAFTLQSVVLEYVTDRLVEKVADEIARGQPVLLVDQPLIKAQAKDYVRQTQEHLIGEPILQQLRAEHGDDGAEQRLVAMLDGWRNRPAAEQGYGPGNVVNLLRLGRGNLRGVDLTHLALRQAYLAGVETQDASLAGSHMSEVVLAEAFNFPICVALSSDGASLVTGTAAGEVWLWRVSDRTPLLALQGHTGQVHGLALSEDGRLLASGSADGTARLWETSSGRLLATLQGHTGTVWGVSLSADGRLLASGGMDQTVRLWEAPFAVGDAAERWAGRRADFGHSTATPPSGGRLLATLQHTGGVWGLALSRDGRLLASGGADGTVQLWETLSGRLLATLQGHTGPVYGLALSPDGRLLASGSQDGTVRQWEASTGRLLATLHGHTGPVSGAAMSPDGRLLTSSSEDGTVRLWEAPSGRLLATLQGHDSGVLGVALSADGQLLASGSQDQTVRLWDAPSGRLMSTLQGHTSGVRRVALSADGRLLASGGMDGAVRLWDTPSGRLLSTLQGHASGVWGVSLSADGQLLASGSQDGTVRLWEASTGRLLATLEGHTSGVWGVALSADGRLLASGSADRTVRLWEASTGRLLATLHGHTAPVQGVALSADGRLLASSSEDGMVRLWEAPFAEVETNESSARRTADSRESSAALPSGGQLLATLRGHIGPVYGVALSADGLLLASGGLDRTVRLWDAPFAGLEGDEPSAGRTANSGHSPAAPASGTGPASADEFVERTADSAESPAAPPGGGRLLATLQGHTRAVFGVALSADGRLLASGGLDGTVRLWEPSSGAALRTLRSDRRYERLDITGLTGVTEAQRAALLTLGAVDHQARAGWTAAGVDDSGERHGQRVTGGGGQ